MKSDQMLTVASLLAIVLASLHLADDVMRGYEPRDLANMRGITLLFVWLAATLLLERRRLCYVLLILGSLLATVMPIAHFRGRGLGMSVTASDGGTFFVWTLFALGIVGMFSLVLSLDGLWRVRRGRPSAERQPQSASSTS